MILIFYESVLIKSLNLGLAEGKSALNLKAILIKLVLMTVTLKILQKKTTENGTETIYAAHGVIS